MGNELEAKENSSLGGTKEEVATKGTAPDLRVPYGACLVDRRPDPSIMVIFGSSGDLTTRKLLPALYSLHIRGGLPEPFAVVGCARKSWSQEEFRNMAAEAMGSLPHVEPYSLSDFTSSLYYQPIQYEVPSSYEELAQTLARLEKELHTGGNLLFYLALPPTAHETTAEMLGRAGLASRGKEAGKWSRIVVEKPFGEDLLSSRSLNRTLDRWFKEEDVFRIDHYLAKETVQNILMFRFANAIFEPIWNRNHVDYVGILAAEQIGVENRAQYYDRAGVLRDMFQNHMLQLLALVAMDPPALFDSERVRDEKARVFRALRPWTSKDPWNDLVLGQYRRGEVEGEEVLGYREEEGVGKESLTPTFASMKVFVDNWRWQGVPFYMVSGKRLARKLTQIFVQFKDVPHSMFQGLMENFGSANRLVMRIHPQEKLTLKFLTKNPGALLCLRQVTMEFDYYSNYQGPKLEAYEKVLLDCLKGDHMLFWRQDGVEMSWEFITPILRTCEECEDPRSNLHFYPAGSWGPTKARSLMDLLISQEDRL